MKASTAKKARMDCDPLKVLHSDVFELIFQHLEFTEIMNSSLVSKSWYADTAASGKCNDKILLKVALPVKLKEFKEIILNQNSQRKYQHIALDNVRRIMPTVMEVLDGRKWKSVSFSTCNFDSNRCSEILKMIEKDVEELKMSSIQVRDTDDNNEALNFFFPKLTKLKLAGLAALRVDVMKFFGNCKNLKVFSATGQGDFIERILANNNGLEELELKNINLHVLQIDYPFNLKALTIETKQPDYECRQHWPRLLNFLKTQADSLETLMIDCTINNQTLELCFQMPKLTELSVVRFDKLFNFHNFRPIPSTTIEKLQIRSPKHYRKFQVLEILFGATPELRILSYDSMDKQSYAIIGRLCQKLETLQIDSLPSFGHIGNPAYLPNLKHFSCSKEIGEQIKNKIIAKTAGRRTPIQQLIFESVQNANPAGTQHHST